MTKKEEEFDFDIPTRKEPWMRYLEDLWEKYISGRLLTKREKNILSESFPNSYGCIDYGERWWICSLCGAVNKDTSTVCGRKDRWCCGTRDEEEKLFKYKPAEQLRMKLIR